MRLLFTLLLLLSLTACGFHLRGSVKLPPELATINVQDARPATDIAPALRNALKSAGTQVSDSAAMVLQLTAEQYGKRVLSVDSAGRAQEYGLSYTVHFLLKGVGAEGENETLWLAEQAVTQTRDLRFDAAAVLGTESEEAQLKAEMRQDAVLQILQRLQAAKPAVVPVANAPGDKSVATPANKEGMQ
jgi:LPS-assembly lipoprotein